MRKEPLPERRRAVKRGLIELSHGGTLFLDEIGELPVPLQGKLLKYFDDHEVMRLGGVESTKVDCTIIAATNRDLEHLVKKKRFRRDLYYRINTFIVKVPPLRERPDDIFDLVNYYLDVYNKKFGTDKKISLAAYEVLQSYRFPGNVRELKSIIKKGVVLSDSNYLDGHLLNGTTISKRESDGEDFGEEDMFVDPEKHDAGPRKENFSTGAEA